jgi:glycosyltransferase involved in cell wall biosynthesis/ubiquinone/menaquinone biosynthesis C-methylase UbiE
MKEINTLLIGILPPPINGQTIAFQALAEELGGDILTLRSKRHEDFWGKLLKIFAFFSLIFRLTFKLIFKQYHVYHTPSQSQEGFLRDFPIVLLSKLLGSEVIIHIHGGNYDGFYESQNTIFKYLIRKMLMMTDSIIVLSDNLKKMLDFEPKLSPKITVIPNGLPFEMDNDLLEKKQLPINKQEPINLIFLSNLIESKGYLDVLEATEILVNRFGYNIKTNFCGEFIQYDDAKKFKKIANAKNYFFDFVERNNLSQNIHYQGVIEGKTKQELLKNAHFFVLPTHYKNEGQPISIIEALANRCVVLTTDYRGISEMITHHKSGVFVDFNKPENLAEQIHFLIQNPSEYEKISKNGHQQYLENYTKEKHLSTLIHAIKSMAKPKNAIDFHSETAVEFDEKYRQSLQFQERFRVWTALFEQFIKPEMSVLDAGCGSGVFSIYLAQKKCTVVGIDGSEKMIDLCNQNVRSRHLSVSFKQEELPLKNARQYANQDVILCSSVLEYITDYEGVIKQFSQILNQKGLLMVSMPNADSWYRKVEKYIFKITNRPSYYAYIQHVLGEKYFSESLQKYGFELQKLVYYPSTNWLSKMTKSVGLNEKYTNTMFVGVYKK